MYLSVSFLCEREMCVLKELEKNVRRFAFKSYRINHIPRYLPEDNHNEKHIIAAKHPFAICVVYMILEELLDVFLWHGGASRCCLQGETPDFEFICDESLGFGGLGLDNFLEAIENCERNNIPYSTVL